MVSPGVLQRGVETCTCFILTTVVLTVRGEINRLRIDMATQLRHLTGALQGINKNGFLKKLQKLNNCICTNKLAMYLTFSGIL